MSRRKRRYKLPSEIAFCLGSKYSELAKDFRISYDILKQLVGRDVDREFFEELNSMLFLIYGLNIQADVGYAVVFSLDQDMFDIDFSDIKLTTVIHIQGTVLINLDI